MSQEMLPFQYQSEKNSSMTRFAGLPLYLRLADKVGLTREITRKLRTRVQGWDDSEFLMSLILLNLAGGDSISDIEQLESDDGLREIVERRSVSGLSRRKKQAYRKRWRCEKSRGFPSNAAIHRYLPQFHDATEETKRVEGVAFIPADNEKLKQLKSLNQPLIEAAQAHSPSATATLDQDATLSGTHKRNALYCYKKFKAYQPLNTYWAEQKLLVHSEFRDGNVPAGFEQLRVLKSALSVLPTSVKHVLLRSDSAGYQSEILDYCAEGRDPRFGTIEFAIAAKVTAPLKKEATALDSSAWTALYKEDDDGKQYSTSQEWAEVGFVPSFAAQSLKQAEYRYVVIREPMKNVTDKTDLAALPFQTIRENETIYKLFSIVTNRQLSGQKLITWHRGRCGDSEHVHSTQKSELAGGKFPSNAFGVNSAWWTIMILAFNLHRLMQITALPKKLSTKRLKAIRFHLIYLPGRLITHARQCYLKIKDDAYQLISSIQEKLDALSFEAIPWADTS